MQNSPEGKDVMDSPRVVRKGVEVSQKDDAMNLILWGYLHEVTYSTLAYAPVEICPLLF